MHAIVSAVVFSCVFCIATSCGSILHASEDPPPSGLISADVAAAISVAIQDYRKSDSGKKQPMTIAELAKRIHAVAFAREATKIDVHILEGTPYTVGGGMSYSIDPKSFTVLEKRPGR